MLDVTASCDSQAIAEQKIIVLTLTRRVMSFEKRKSRWYQVAGARSQSAFRRVVMVDRDPHRLMPSLVSEESPCTPKSHKVDRTSRLSNLVKQTALSESHSHQTPWWYTLITLSTRLRRAMCWTISLRRQIHRTMRTSQERHNNHQRMKAAIWLTIRQRQPLFAWGKVLLRTQIIQGSSRAMTMLTILKVSWSTHRVETRASRHLKAGAGWPAKVWIARSKRQIWSKLPMRRLQCRVRVTQQVKVQRLSCACSSSTRQEVALVFLTSRQRLAMPMATIGMKVALLVSEAREEPMLKFKQIRICSSLPHKVRTLTMLKHLLQR